MPKKRKRKTPRRKAQHPNMGAAMNLDRRTAAERRADAISGRCGYCGGIHPAVMGC